MLTPHAILLKRANFDEIVHWTHTTEKQLEETFQEAIEKGQACIVVFDRYPDGTPKWLIYTAEEFASEFEVGTDLTRFATHFTKI